MVFKITFWATFNFFMHMWYRKVSFLSEYAWLPLTKNLDFLKIYLYKKNHEDSHSFSKHCWSKNTAIWLAKNTLSLQLKNKNFHLMAVT